MRIVLSYLGTAAVFAPDPASLSNRRDSIVAMPKGTSCDPGFPLNRSKGLVGWSAATRSCSSPVRYTSSMDTDAARTPSDSSSLVSWVTSVVLPQPCGALNPTTRGGHAPPGAALDL